MIGNLREDYLNLFSLSEEDDVVLKACSPTVSRPAIKPQSHIRIISLRGPQSYCNCGFDSDRVHAYVGVHAPGRPGIPSMIIVLLMYVAMDVAPQLLLRAGDRDTC